MIENPLVTVNILSFNRKDELRNTLTKVYEQDYKNIEIIVVDNASSDGSIEMVEKEFPEVQLIKLEKNIGIAGWNEGFKVAKGEYVLVLDDDSHPAFDAIERGVIEMRRNEDIGIVAFQIFDRATNSIVTENLFNNKVLFFIGCGALLSLEALKEINYFNESLFLYEHEIEFTMNVYDIGYNVKYCASAIVYHSKSNLNRRKTHNVDRRRVFFTTRNIVFLLLTKFYFRKIFFRIVRISLGRIFLSIRYHCFFPVLRGLFLGILLSFQKMNDIKVLSNKTQALYEYGKYAGGFFGQGSMFQ